MAFIKSGATVLSFAEYQDIVDRDQRLFEANEGLTIDIVEDQLIRSTERILTEFRASDWWKDYYGSQGGSVSRVDIPALDSNKIIARKKTIQTSEKMRGVSNLRRTR